MGYQYVHKLLTVIGTSANGNETWQFGLRSLDLAVPSRTPQQWALEAAPVIENWWRGTGYDATNKILWLDTLKLTELKAASIAMDGTYEAGTNSYSHFYLPAIAGTYTTWSGWMPQASTCVTLTTGKPRGYASKGRIYLPPNDTMTTTLNGVIGSTSATRAANNIKKLINDLNALPNVGPISIFSKGKGVKVDDVTDKRWEWTYPNAGFTEAVTGCRVGQVVDTQRRRRRSLVEAPQAVQL